MDYRLGKCSSCGAEYKVPSSFAHDVARCKVCKGVVWLGPSSAPSQASREDEPLARPAPRSAPAPKAELRAPARAAASTPTRVPRSTPVPRPATPRSNESGGESAGEGGGESAKEAASQHLSPTPAERPRKIRPWALIGLVLLLALLGAVAIFFFQGRDRASEPAPSAPAEDPQDIGGEDLGGD